MCGEEVEGEMKRGGGGGGGERERFKVGVESRRDRLSLAHHSQFVFIFALSVDDAAVFFFFFLKFLKKL